jgi:hypothetical protein
VSLRQVAVLFARADSIYKTMEGVDVYDMARDARTFQGGAPIVGHPPCRAWGALSHMKRVKPRQDEKALAPWCVAQIRQDGGVLEHPKGSKLWRYLGLPEPDCLPDEYGGFTLLIDQYDWGHLAHKATRLYICGLSMGDVPPMPPPNTAPTQWSIAGASPNGGVKGTHRITDAQREHTPPALAEWLVELARRTRTPKSPAPSADEVGHE